MKYKIGDFLFEICAEEGLEFPKHFQLFAVNTEEKPEVRYELFIVDELPEMEGDCISQRPDIQIFEKDHLESRRLSIVGMPVVYGVYREISKEEIHCFLHRDFLHMLSADTIFVSLFALEKQMIARRAVILHCSVVKVGKQVMLFSGPSGIGKSTHADLWVKYRGATVINGDRTLICKKGDQWMSLGWPICGSSEICRREDYPISRIVFLGQAERNQGRRLSYVEGIKRVISQTTANNWNAEFVQKVWQIVEVMAADIPIYEYACNMEEEAVEGLERLVGETKEIF